VRLVMAEKPSVAQDLARVMDPGAKSAERYIEGRCATWTWGAAHSSGCAGPTNASSMLPCGVPGCPTSASTTGGIPAGTLLMREDGRVFVAQRSLGHARASITLDLYGHRLPSDQRVAVGRVQEARRKAAASQKPVPKRKYGVKR
jgi:hypothetical protein